MKIDELKLLNDADLIHEYKNIQRKARKAREEMIEAKLKVRELDMQEHETLDELDRRGL